MNGVNIMFAEFQSKNGCTSSDSVFLPLTSHQKKGRLPYNTTPITSLAAGTDPSNATPLVVKIHPFSKRAVTVEPLMQF